MPIILRILLSCLLLSACGDGDEPAPSAGPQIELTRTSYGVVHVRAHDFAGLGFGLAYAYAQDNICMLADSLLTVRGERSRYFGGGAMPTSGLNGEYSVVIDYLDEHRFDLDNEDSDFFFKAYLDVDRLRALYASGSREAVALLSGYAAGYNRYLREHATDLPAACRGAPWVKPISVDDMYLLVAEKALHASGQVFARQILAAAREPGGHSPPAPAAPPLEDGGLGSNAVALGSDASANGGGMLLANPHYPWFSTDRFYQVHLTIPGVYDAMGASLGALPIVVIGFNRNVAWTHTVTKALHFTTFRLQLDPSDPARKTYLLDGVRVPITERTVDVDLLQPDGSLRTRRKLFRETPLGMAMAVADLPLGADAMLVLGDPNRDNTRLIEQWIAMGKADSAESLRAAMARVMGLPWVNTVAADRYGTALFADFSVVPHVTTAKFASDCLLLAPLLMFDGSRAACLWGRDPDAPPGIFGSGNAPQMTRRDYVANSNDSYWLTNARQLLTGPGDGYSPMYGPVAVPQHLRTRLGFVQLEEMLARRGKLNGDDLTALLFSNRVHAAELVLPDLLRACGNATDETTRQACIVLSAWDRKVDLDSRGAVLFREFWLRAKDTNGLWAVPFDPRDPLHTPRGVAPSAIGPLLAALRDAAGHLRDLYIPLEARLGDYQQQTIREGSVPLHGGIGDVDGVYNALHPALPLTAAGYGNAAWGTSYVQIVGFSAEGPVARGLLVYGQSTDPLSPHHGDQLTLYANKQLVALPFAEREIAADRGWERTVLLPR